MLSMEKAGLDFRATKNLDIVLFVEALSSTFAATFWGFIKEGKYQFRQKSTGKKQFYRFHSPAERSYPDIIELFSRTPEKVFLKEESHLTPIPINEEISSLSAILLNDDYYQFIHRGKILIDDISIINPAHIIPLKAKAFLDLSSISSKNIHVDAKDIRKHRNDIIKLHQLLSPSEHIQLPISIQKDMKKFIDLMAKDCNLNLKSLGLKNISLNSLIDILKHTYGINP